ncbi:MAG: hypothetical protein LBH21_04255 [Gracilibacteraceae bacterium]|jgi:cell division protein FtsB|nr:hypothetical protein [Gracilibacteraceae bacterium]
MYGVSLLPPEYKIQLQESKRARLVVFVAIVIAAVLLLVFLLTLAFRWNYSIQISALEAEQEQLQAVISELKDEETIVNEVINTSQNINNLLTSASKLSANIVGIGDALPDRVAVKEISVEYDLQKITGTLQLEAPDERTLRECVDQLRLMEGVSKVDWDQLKTTGTGLMPVSCNVTLELQRVALD